MPAQPQNFIIKIRWLHYSYHRIFSLNVLHHEITVTYTNMYRWTIAVYSSPDDITEAEFVNISINILLFTNNKTTCLLEDLHFALVWLTYYNLQQKTFFNLTVLLLLSPHEWTIWFTEVDPEILEVSFPLNKFLQMIFGRNYR